MASPRRTTRPFAALALAFVGAVPFALLTPAAAQEDPEPLPLGDAIAEMDRAELATVDAPADGFPTYQYGDDPTAPAQLEAAHGTVESASAGLFFFGDEVAVDCADPAGLCTVGAPPDGPTDDLYFGMSMTFAGDVPLDGVDGQIINYSFPFFDPAAEPFEHLPQFPGDTWQGMNNVVVAESRSPFTLTGLNFTPAGGWLNSTRHSFGLADGREVWVFVPFGANPEEIDDMRAAIGTALAEGNDPNQALQASLPQRIADWISRGKWSVAVHIHGGDFGRDQPSTITAVPHTPRGPGVSNPMPMGVTFLGSGGFDFLSPAEPEPIDDPARTETDDPAEEADDEPPVVDDSAEDAAEDVIDETAAAADDIEIDDPAEDGPPLAAIGGGVIVIAGVSFLVGKRRKGELKEPAMTTSSEVDDAAIEAAADDQTIEMLDAMKDHNARVTGDEVDEEYTRPDGVHVHTHGLTGFGGEITYTFPDGTVRRDQEGQRARTIEIAHANGTREVWTGTERYAHDNPSQTWEQESSYTRYDAAGEIIEQTDTDTHPWPDAP